MRVGRGLTDAEAPPVARWLDDTGATSPQRPPAWVVDLIGSAPPIQVPVALKQRMLLSLGGGRQRRQGGWLRPMVAAGVLIGGSAIASAAFTDWPARVVRVCRELAAPALSADRPAPERRPGRALVEPTWQDEAMAVPVAPAPSAMPHRRASEGTRPRGHVHAAGPEDPSLVVEATRALRVDRDRGGPACWRLATGTSTPPARWSKRRWPSRSKPRWTTTTRT